MSVILNQCLARCQAGNIYRERPKVEAREISSFNSGDVTLMDRRTKRGRERQIAHMRGGRQKNIRGVFRKVQVSDWKRERKVCQAV